MIKELLGFQGNGKDSTKIFWEYRREVARLNELAARRILLHVAGRLSVFVERREEEIKREVDRWKDENYNSLWEQRRQYFLRDNNGKTEKVFGDNQE